MHHKRLPEMQRIRMGMKPQLAVSRHHIIWCKFGGGGRMMDEGELICALQCLFIYCNSYCRCNIEQRHPTLQIFLISCRSYWDLSFAFPQTP